MRKPRKGHPGRSRGLLIGGVLLWGLSYVGPAITGAVVATQCDCGEALRMFIPIVGPLTLVHKRYYNPLIGGETTGDVVNALLIADSVLQVAGLLITIFGIQRYNATGRGHHDDDYGRITPHLSWTAALTPGGSYASLIWRM